MKCIICKKRQAKAKKKCLKCYEKLYRVNWRKKNPLYMRDYMRNVRMKEKLVSAIKIKKEVFG